jgi:hypothetical protein
MPVYKFLSSEHIDRVLIDRTLVLSRLSYFRGLEHTDDLIGDRLENAAQLNLNNIVLTNAMEVEKLNLAAGRVVINVDTNWTGNLKINNSIALSEGPDHFIFSASIGDLHDLRKRMCESGSNPYDACVEIANLHRLSRQIYSKGVLQDGRRVYQVLGQPRSQRVLYIRPAADYPSRMPAFPSPFVKHPLYQAQSEIRIVMPIIDSTLPDRIIVTVPGLERRVSEVFRKSRA